MLGAMSTPAQMKPSSSRISPERPDPHPMSKRYAGWSGGKFSSSRARYVMSLWICWFRVLPGQFVSQCRSRRRTEDELWCIFFGFCIAVILSKDEVRYRCNVFPLVPTISGGAWNSGRRDIGFWWWMVVGKRLTSFQGWVCWLHTQMVFIKGN